MLLHLTTPFAFSNVGQRPTNQDALYPAVGGATSETTLFIVCDGMGGADKGEVASELLGKSIMEYATAMDYPILDIVHLQSALDWAYNAYRDYLQCQPFVNRMGSTFALFQAHQQGVTIAHIGDSRVYQIRAGKILFQTRDHRQVADMVESGIITAEQALTHPWRNRLSRAVVCSQSDKSRPTSRPIPDVVMLTDIHPDDYFFMCTDGVLEHIDDYTLEKLMEANVPDQAKIQSIEALCEGRTKDNYSGYLIGIRYVTQTEPVPSIQTF
ncbi:protein phosphatase 2C domain-containing protein [Spirosoma harenae]